MSEYDKAREEFKPKVIKVLFIAESPPPSANVQSSRHFYRHEKIRRDDRLFVNTIKALYSSAEHLTEAQIEESKRDWLSKFMNDGFYMIEALRESQVHEVTKKERQQKIAISATDLVERVKKLANADTKIILIKSNVFDIASKPLRDAGFNVLNKGLVDYPGHFNQTAYRQKVQDLLA
ncbi:MAG TPA: hypothetical protein VLA77_00205 [Candidatus Saccharimonadales bacterium]|nr:hypothetical protein [Candidatus Saccharimonadales bacterium]